MALALCSPGWSSGSGPYLLVLGVAQDGGVPQLGSERHPAWRQPELRRLATSLALVDPRVSRRWLIEATPDIREQLYRLEQVAPRGQRPAPGLDGIFLTHAHIGHYAGLLLLGHESVGAQGVVVHVMPGMRAFLEANGPWNQLVKYGNVELQTLAENRPLALAPDLQVTAFQVPHRQEFSEVVGYRIRGPRQSVLFIPDIDSWSQWEAAGTRLEDAVCGADVALLDGTFFADGEIPGRDMSGFPHPRIKQTMARLQGLPAEVRARVRFIHLNHTNPALDSRSSAANEMERRGFRVAREGDVIEL